MLAKFIKTCHLKLNTWPFAYFNSWCKEISPTEKSHILSEDFNITHLDLLKLLHQFNENSVVKFINNIATDSDRVIYAEDQSDITLF